MMCAKMCDMKRHTKLAKGAATVRRSIALPRRLLEEVTRDAPADAASNWNRLVVTALEEYAERQKLAKLEEAMGRMAADPAIRAEIKTIDRLFRNTERDGLR